MDFVNGWSEKTGIGLGRFIGWLGIARSKFYNWHARYGKVNEHNGKMPRDFWLDDWEKQAIVHFHENHPDEGYRRLTSSSAVSILAQKLFPAAAHAPFIAAKNGLRSSMV